MPKSTRSAHASAKLSFYCQHIYQSRTSLHYCYHHQGTSSLTSPSVYKGNSRLYNQWPLLKLPVTNSSLLPATLHFVACTAEYTKNCIGQLWHNLAKTIKHQLSLLISVTTSCAKDQWCTKDKDDKSYPHLQQQIESWHHTYGKWPLRHPQEIDSPPAFWGYPILEPGNHTEKYLYYTALTLQQNLKLGIKSKHFFQKAPPAQRRPYWFDCTNLVKLMQTANANTSNLIGRAFDQLILTQWFTNAS